MNFVKIAPHTASGNIGGIMGGNTHMKRGNSSQKMDQVGRM